jgi:hypothetical protein
LSEALAAANMQQFTQIVLNINLSLLRPFDDIWSNSCFVSGSIRRGQCNGDTDLPAKGGEHFLSRIPSVGGDEREATI